MKKVVVVSLSLVFALNLSAQLVVDASVTAEDAVQNILLGEGVEAFNVTFAGDANQIGSFNSANSNIGINSGIMLATGDIAVAIGPNDNGGASLGGGNAGFGDPDLTALSTFNTNDAAILEFDFIATGDQVSFRYVFGSEEYNEYVCGSVNDAFGFFLSGPGFNGPFSLNAVNLALIPDTDIPVTINTVNLGVSGAFGTPSNCAQVSPNWADNAEFYIDNENNNTPTSTQLDGLTVILEASASGLLCGETYHIKIAIADAGDTVFDSCVFLEAGSFSSNDVSITATIPNAPPNFPPLTLLEGCIDGFITIFRPTTDANDQVQLIVGGTATPGDDYEELPDVVIFPEGELTVDIPIVTIYDAIDEDTETITVTYDYIDPCDEEVTVEVELNLLNYTPPTLDLPEEIFLCGGDSETVSAQPDDGFAPFTYLWSTGATTSSINVTASGPDFILVGVEDYCGFGVADSFVVIVPDPLVIPEDDWTCIGRTVSLSPTGGAPPYEVTFDSEDLSFNEGSYSSVVPGFYEITYTDQCGVTGNFELEVRVCDTTIPNIFSPNNDGVNDSFFIRGWEGFRNSRLEVYNRWGTLVYENDDYRSDWRANDVAEGTYFYIYYRSDGETFSGTLQIVRTTRRR